MHTLTTVRYGRAPTPFGFGLIGWTEQGIVLLHLQQTEILQARDVLASEFPDCTFVRDDLKASDLLEQVFQQGKPDHPKPSLKLALTGSPFQLKVWQGLRGIPFGEVRSYGALAESLGHPGAARAVGTAVAANKLAYLVPCHRVIRASGETGQFRWGAEVKAQMLAWEASELAVSHAAR
jgi:AraC family transcriptional regulator of adaptative response/methylated-DNA-[protein]-cysteine methyltransferase